MRHSFHMNGCIGLMSLLILSFSSLGCTGLIASMRWNTRVEPRASQFGKSCSILFTIQRGFAREYIEWHRQCRVIGPNIIQQHPTATIPRWSQPGLVSLDRLEEIPEFGAQVAAGWPVLCFVGEVPRTSAFGTTSIGPRGVVIIGTLEIPYRPLFPGLVINLIVHSAAWWCVIHVVGNLLRRIVRRRRKDNGLCMNCGYDVYDQPSGSKCPECGEARW